MNRIERMLQELCPEGVEYKKLGEVCAINRGIRVVRSQLTQESKYPVYQNSLIPLGNYDYFNCEANTTFIIAAGAAGKIGFCKSPFWAADDCFYFKSQKLEQRYIYHELLSNQDYFIQKVRKASVPRISRSIIEKFEIPVPPLPIQEEIVRILDHFTELTASLQAELQAELQARQEQYEYYNNRLLSFDDDIPKMKLNDVVTFMNGKGHEKYIEDQGAYIVVNSKFISTAGKVIKYSNSQISPLYKDMILMVMSDLPNGKALAKCFVVDADNKYTLNQRIGAFTIRDKNLITTRFLYYILDRNKQLLSYDNGADQTNLRKGDILNIIIPVPPLSEQQRIVSILDKFETLVNDLSQGLPAEITAVQEQYEYYRNKLLTFNRIKSN